eukprot:CAMPEP_0177192936 /NCGR_PEP_ID=MMETSP0367-20130122/22168_1 /TAXON_ID=447022 ORGANISM="Scrippsiella hangoei-like, Strain SHHI-4" /NCGR_SAMPLE_ID=MMETSP0367 /ASSEMBLY_ACC=CAM_ASM_000362 /LENGTH=201 /DNA_ID=CAMNT_0018640775 /DNA_START=71 /DNA_END=676 /DNA_ORIENTATION=-
MVRLLVALSLVSAVAANAGPKNYADEADAVRNMMEAAPRAPEAPAAGARRKPALVAAASTTAVWALDTELFGNADRVERELREMSAASAGKQTALATKSTETSQQRAARFFATHGMLSVGKLLGAEISASEAAKAAKEASEVQQRLASSINLRATSFHTASARQDDSNLSNDIDMEEEKEEQAQRQLWKMVDNLRHRAPRV